MKEPFEIEWLGGVAEKHFRRLRPGVSDLPWGTLDPSRYPAPLVAVARMAWTQIALSEYRAALSFSELLKLLLEARAPLDLVGMAGDFVADEVSHVEIASRVAMELGGGVGVEVDTAALLLKPAAGLEPLARANERMVRTCIHETFSESIATGAMKTTTQPLLKAAQELISRDEARHTRIGWLYFDWASELLDEPEQARLGEIATRIVEQLARTLRERTSRVKDGVTTEGYLVEHVRELGWMDSESYRARAIGCIRKDIVPPLAKRGIVVDAERLSRALGSQATQGARGE